jgi:hypothetical protein
LFARDTAVLWSVVPCLRRNRTGGEGEMNALMKKVLPTFDVVKWGVPTDKLDQLAALLGLSDADKKALLSKGDVVIVQDPKKA